MTTGDCKENCTKDYSLKALTDIWTGDVYRQGNRLIPTGLLGSIRWWFEVLVRGLGGKACDPTVHSVRCPDANKEPHEAGHHCVVCELFGCTAWARKFRLMVLDDQGNLLQGQTKANQTFTLRFIPLRPTADEEWWLLDATLRLIADYGAIGGKTVLKPSEDWGIADLVEANLENEPSGGVKVKRSRGGLPLIEGEIIQEVNGKKVSNIKQLKQMCAPLPHGTPITVMVTTEGRSRQKDVWAGKRHHQDFGLIEYQDIVRPKNWKCNKSLEELKSYISRSQWRQNVACRYRAENGQERDYSWASLQNFWCVKGRYLARQDQNTSSFNFVIARPEPKGQSARGSPWLAGGPQESKKVFSFKEPESARRTFGFVKPGSSEFDEMRNRLSRVWQSFNPANEFLTGEKIIGELFLQKESA